MRPSGRHILTIGRDLIQDGYAAIIEIVKNSYDADSPDVNIIFKATKDRSQYTIIIEDHGHGMSRDTVINHWMVPSTDDKKKRRTSPNGRIMQGRKGVGRYAASILGNDLLLETSTKNELTTVYIEWSAFEKAQYLDDVEILVESKKKYIPSGTRLTITGDNEQLSEWNQKQIDKLKFELKKLISPINNVLIDNEIEDVFEINLKFENFLMNQNNITKELIKPYPIFDLFDYKIEGQIDVNGNGNLVYTSQKAKNTITETIQFDFGSSTGCGELFFDIRVYDREKEAIESLIDRGLFDESGKYLRNLQARQILNQYNGIGVYRNGFRIRPLGDADFDWLKLNEQRVQKPTLRIGSNQVIGFVQIQSEEQSNLIEKSARDGLKENGAFNRLKEISRRVIACLEERRYSYRKKVGLSRYSNKIEKQFEKLFFFKNMKNNITAKLRKGDVDKNITSEIIQLINNEEENNSRIINDIRQSVAIYQGQATLGKIINVVLHEGRHPLNNFKNQIPNLEYFINTYIKKQNLEILKKIIPISKDIGENAKIFVDLFRRLDPLAAGKRGNKKLLPLKVTIEEVFNVFESIIKENNIITNVNGSDEFSFSCWYQDIYAIFTNLIDNSIYWMNEKNTSKKEIKISIVTDGNNLQYIDYKDTGPGIESNLIIDKVIFEPEFTTKQDGKGLGLAIAGEVSIRNGLELKAFDCKDGAYFRLQMKSENYND